MACTQFRPPDLSVEPEPAPLGARSPGIHMCLVSPPSTRRF
ncbi:hypothetical protein SAMCFNEI73_pC1810 (plasmid) [Sinorhizobium americanum]|uniref:Uncharacterized protein n=1 Tax=Sinorhizobium americanum TaxID=194963 RepID=A0A1L3LZI8_9HYPH|nr:hypothetical protein SAMCFNEI73_pC1810 [Sinorhizobium americanum]